MKYLIAIVALCLALVGTNATASDEQQLSHYAQPQGAIVIERAPVVRLFGGALRTVAWPFTPKYYYIPPRMAQQRAYSPLPVRAGF